ncbi:hypothetical protein L1987_85488 [Smallanthus sonchifolius]|uniref:Uncharacterized protein n=1 Tax=Smallanthus sonchifolius TaxID=185202 RepID=A0ACB8XXH8_9ASTR|nr:hypothetical protein L1987_85488 [Smallanthus sonchifolius]
MKMNVKHVFLPPEVVKFLLKNRLLSEVKRAALMASFTIHKPRERSHFTKAAFKTVSIFVKACKEHIDILKTSITNEEANSKGWLGIMGANANAGTIAHKHGVTCRRWCLQVLLLA